jgi:hypothetical protein
MRSRRELQLPTNLNLEMHDFRINFTTNHRHSCQFDHPWAATLPLSLSFLSLSLSPSFMPGLKLLCQEGVGGPGKDSKSERNF